MAEQNNIQTPNGNKLPLTSMDAGLLRQIAAKVDDDLIDVNDAKILRGIADSVDSVLEWCEGARSKEEVEEILFGDTQQPEDTVPTEDPVSREATRLRAIEARAKEVLEKGTRKGDGTHLVVANWILNG